MRERAVDGVTPEAVVRQPNAGRISPWRLHHDRFVGFLLLMPLVVLITGLTIYPISQVISLSFYQQSLFQREATFVGLDNFRAVLGHEAFWRSLENNFVFAFGSLGLQMIIGLLVALLLNHKFPLRAPIRGAMLFSYLVPYVVAALTWRFMMSDATGILNYLIRQSGLGMPASLFGSPDWAMFGVILVNTWKTFRSWCWCSWRSCRPSTTSSTNRPPWMAPAAGSSSATSPCRP